MADKRWYVGLDVGGTTMKAAVVDDTGQHTPSISLPTQPERGQELGLATMEQAIRAAVAAAKLSMVDITAIGVATPGLMDLKAGLILDPPNLKPWRNVPVRQHIRDVFQLPTAYQNDGNAAAFGEFWVGAGHDAYSMVLFTLGTGIGGGIIIGDMILEGQHSHGGELGHMKIEMTNPRLCGCGRYGCLEAYASATGVVKRTRELMCKPRSYQTALANLTEEGFTAEAIFTAAANGDALAQGVVDDTAYYLAVGAANVMHTINPDMIVYGGGMIAAGEPFLERIRYYIKQVGLTFPSGRTLIRYAQLGSDAGFIGAAGCARQLVLKTKHTLG